MIQRPIRIDHKRVVLRELCAADAPRMYAYRSLPEVSRFQGWEPESIEEVEGFISSLATISPGSPGSWFQLGIELLDCRALIGDCGIHVLSSDPRQAEVGVALAPEHQRCGLATEAMEALLGLLFGTLGKHRVIGSVDPGNLASIRLLRRIGLRQEAHHVQSLWFKGRWADDLIFAILAEEWKQRNEQAR